MKYPENIAGVRLCEPDLMGFIFYEKSPRYVTNELSPTVYGLKENLETVGVFVNSPIETVIDKVNRFSLDYVQLHGDETVTYVTELKNKKINIIKAFRIDENFDWSSINKYDEDVSYFLFDTATKNYGGSGLKFDWKQLTEYQGNTPFFLSGGIEIGDIQEIENLEIPMLYGIDVNSKFEIEPGLKDIELVRTMINQIKT